MSERPLITQSRRSETSRQAILDAVLTLCSEHGYGALSIEGIAARAGVGKQTIYRWWPSKGAVLLEALDKKAAVAATFPDTGNLIADMYKTFRDIAKFQTEPDLGPPFAALIAESQQDPYLGNLVVERFINPRRAPILDRLRKAQERGEIAPHVNLEALLQVAFGALFHRLLLPTGPLNARYVRFVVDVVFGGIATAD